MVTVPLLYHISLCLPPVRIEETGFQTYLDHLPISNVLKVVPPAKTLPHEVTLLGPGTRTWISVCVAAGDREGRGYFSTMFTYMEMKGSGSPPKDTWN